MDIIAPPHTSRFPVRHINESEDIVIADLQVAILDKLSKYVNEPIDYRGELITIMKMEANILINNFKQIYPRINFDAYILDIKWHGDNHSITISYHKPII